MAEEMEAQRQRETEIMTYAEWFANEFDSWAKEQTAVNLHSGTHLTFSFRSGCLMLTSICLATS